MFRLSSGGQGRVSRPVESPPGLVNGTGQYYPEDDRFSFDSRSLTAFSNYSEKDSVTAENGYRYAFLLNFPDFILVNKYACNNKTQNVSSLKSSIDLHKQKVSLFVAVFYQL